MVADSNLRNARAAATADFLRTNDLSLLVRSHEAVYAGYLWNYGPSDVDKLSPGPYASANLGGESGGVVASGEGEVGLAGGRASHCCLTLFSCSKYSRAHPCTRSAKVDLLAPPRPHPTQHGNVGRGLEACQGKDP